MTLKLLSDDLLALSIGYLSKNDILSCSSTSLGINRVSKRDSLWKSIVWNEYEMDDSNMENPPGYNEERSGDDLSKLTWFELYLRWRVHFSGYTCAEISLARRWWLHIERYLIQNAVDIFNTLNLPASEAFINEVDIELRKTSVGVRPGCAIPRSLRILYRFHNGQNIALNEVRLRTPKARATYRMLQSECLDRPNRLLLEKQMHLGLFGGVSFYDTCVVCSLLPLEHFKAARDLTFRDSSRRLTVQVDGSSFVPIADAYAQADAAQPQDMSPPWLSANDAVVFSINTSTWYDVPPGGCHKVFMVDSVDHRTGKSAGDVYTNVNNNGADSVYMPCVDYRRLACAGDVRHSRQSNVSGITGSLFDWLFEYLRRLEQGIYRMEPANLSEAQPDSFLLLSHFQSPQESQRVLESERSKAVRAEKNPQLYRLPSSKLLFSSADNCSLGHSVVGEEGVEATFCPSFVPNLSYFGPSSSFTWTYSVRLRLLSKVLVPRDTAISTNPEAQYRGNAYYHIEALNDDWHFDSVSGSYLYHGSLQECTLTRRHWVIGTEDDEPEIVDGDGVVGLFPVLRRGADEDSTKTVFTFGYQSMNKASAAKSFFKGHLQFAASIRGENKLFVSRIHENEIAVPVFIY